MTGGGGRVEWKRMEKWKVNSKMARLVRCFTMMGRCFKSWKCFDCIVTNHGTPRVLCLAFEPYCLVTRFCDPRLFVNNANGIGSLVHGFFKRFGLEYLSRWNLLAFETDIVSSSSEESLMNQIEWCWSSIFFNNIDISIYKFSNFHW